MTESSCGPATTSSGDDEEQEREDHHDLDQPRDDGVDPAAEVAGEDTHDHAEADRADRREQRDLEGRLRAVEQAQEEVAAEAAVGAEDEQLLRPVTGRTRIRRGADPRPGADRRERLRVDAVREDVVRAVPEEVREDRPADERQKQQEDDEADADDGELVAPEADAHELPVAARLDGFRAAYRQELRRPGRRRWSRRRRACRVRCSRGAEQ